MSVTSSFPRKAQRPYSAASLIEDVRVPALSVTGDRQVTITSVATPEEAVTGSLCFCQDDDVTELHPAFSTQASLLVVSAELPAARGRCTVRAEDPRCWAAAAVRLLFPRSAFIDPTARLGERVRLGARVSLGAYATIGDDVTIGDDTNIGSHAAVAEGTAIGARCDIQPGAVIGSDGFAHYRDPDQSMYTFPHLGRVWIGDDVEIGANCVIVRGMVNDTIVEDGVKIGNLCNIGHNCTLHANAGLTAHVVLAGSVTLGEHCDIGLGATIKQHVRIGAGARVGMGSVVTKDVEAREGVFGTPAKPLRTMRSLTWPNR
jgi:UDP-3-O-[3-hydroxymyristoyl] glucosamine N-acyltransferase